jgi:hypothetical protein
MTLTITPINRGTVPNDGTGDTAYDAAGKINDNFTSVADELVANLTASNAYADNLVVGLWDDRGNFDASTNLFPTTGGSGAGGAILKGDIWTISIPATSGALTDYPVNSTVRALANSPGQTAANWAVQTSTTSSWKTTGGIWTFEATDSPSATIKIPGDVTNVIGVGFRIKLTQSATVKYFIVTLVGAYNGVETVITVFGGTDYTLVNAAISSPYYSDVKFPIGFPADATKWVYRASYNTSYTKTAASGIVINIIYNLLSVISLPVGSWDVNLKIPNFRCYNTSTSASAISIIVGLSTANNTFAYDELLLRIQSNNEPAGNVLAKSGYASKKITTAVKLAMYLNVSSNVATVNDMTIAGDLKPFTVEYVSILF